jgi:hypothetical protein
VSPIHSATSFWTGNQEVKVKSRAMSKVLKLYFSAAPRTPSWVRESAL